MKFLFVLFLCSSPAWGLIKIDESKPIVKSANARIIGGSLARAGQYPWLAAIWKYTNDGRYFCAGSLFNEQWILTAAQCVINATQFIIQLGSNTLEGDDPYRVTLASTEYFYEPRFDPSVNLAHDIGLIKLRMPVELNDYIQPVVTLLYSEPPRAPGRPVEAAGWGQTSDDGGLVNELHFVDMALISQNECRGYYGEQLWNSMGCAEGNYNEGPCFGDTGSPLMTPALVGNHTIQIGLATFLSQNGCESTDPTGYTLIVTNYRLWVTSTIRNNTDTL